MVKPVSKQAKAAAVHAITPVIAVISPSLTVFAGHAKSTGSVSS